jgi:hypothetical protein
MAAAPRWKGIAVGVTAFFVIVAGVIAYWPGLRVPYFGDDFRYIFQGWPLRWGYFFTHRDGDPHGFRPLQNLLLAAIQSRAGWETWPIHAIALLLHICLCGLVFVAARRLRLSLMQAGVAAVFAMLWQFSVSAVVGCARFSQLESTLFGSASMLALLSVGQAATGGRRVALRAVSILCYLIAAFSKETSGGFLLVIILYLVWTERSSGLRWAGRTALLVAPYLAVEAVYFALRIHTGATPPSAMYSLGTRLIRNLGLIGASIATPVSSVIMATAVHRRSLPVLCAIVALSGLTVALVMVGIRKSGRKRLAMVLLILAVVALAPVIPVRQVSELYMYGAMPFLAVLFGLGIGALLEDRRWRALVSAFFAFWVALNAQAVYSKAEMMDLNGRRAMAMLDVIRRSLPDVPQNGRILLAYSPAASDYSIFLVNGFGVLIVGTSFIGPLLGRPDVDVELVPPVQVRALAADRHSVVFTFEDGQMRGPLALY